ncbi:hypothetical protein GK0146 [Geobacillus kaustophilus HTA426]|uniref:Uncharacterized protein n=1 Tax=Geobacillus kaustophilus (strain HTA426) TaxID=235909 RepID=Q5L3P9_GEOKA|nr:hypothetical protein GK0146 [Geobacillus kaustophilus HTA426]
MLPLLLLSFLVLGSCAPQEISPPPPDYDETKKMVVDILKLTFRTLPTKIGRIFSFRCRMNP